MFVEERHIRILEHIENKKKITVADVREMFNVSLATARKDLKELEEKNLITRTHGGAIIKTKTKYEENLKERITKNVKIKQAIAKVALSYIEDGDTIILDGGTTTLELAKILNSKNNLTVITNDLSVALALEEYNIQIIFLGGIIRNGFHSALGANSIKMLYELSADKAFLGANSLSLEKGFGVPDILLSETKQQMTKSANKVFILCDSTKFGKNSLSQFASLDDVHILITDNIDEALKVKLETHEIDIILAKK